MPRQNQEAASNLTSKKNNKIDAGVYVAKPPAKDKASDIQEEESPNSMPIAGNVKSENVANYKPQPTQSNAIILPSLTDLENKVVLEDKKQADIFEAKQKELALAGKIEIDLDPEKVGQSLKEYADNLKQQSKQILGSLVASVDFSLNKELVLLKVDSKVKDQQLKEIKEDLAVFLKQKLEEESIQLKIVLVEASKITKPAEPYSPKERLQAMMQENPAVKDLIEKLDLNFDI